MTSTTKDTVAEIIGRTMQDLTRTERRVAQTLLSQYPLLGLETLSRVANAAQTTAPTVLRFVTKLGYPSYADFQQALRDELQPQLQSALSRYTLQSPEVDSDHFLQRFVAAASGNIQRAAELLPPQEFDDIVTLLSDTSRPVLCIGGRFSSTLAHSLFNFLNDIRPRVSLVWNQTETWPSHLLDVGKRHVVVAFDFRRYQSDVTRFTERADAQGATVVVFTDEWMSGISRFAKHVIMAPVTAPSLYDTTVASLVQMEAIVGAVALQLKKSSEQRITKLEELRREAAAGEPRDG